MRGIAEADEAEKSRFRREHPQCKAEGTPTCACTFIREHARA
jgi:hypothetical protein